MPFGKIGRVGGGRASQAMDADLYLGYNQEGVVTELHGKYYQSTLAGNGYLYSAAAAGVAVATLGNNLPTLWNPAGSGRNIEITKVTLGWQSTTFAVGHFVYGLLTQAGANVATAGPILTFTNITPTNLLAGAGGQPVGRFATTCTFTTAPTFLATLGISQAALTAATAAWGGIMMDDVDGRIVLAPGSALQVAGSTAMNSAVVCVSIYGVETAIPQLS
jgi:hypothetical protein